MFLVTSIALCVLAVAVLVVHVYRIKRSSRRLSPELEKPDKVDTTLGEFRDMREALRPLRHTRVASRRVPQKRP